MKRKEFRTKKNILFVFIQDSFFWQKVFSITATLFSSRNLQKYKPAELLYTYLLFWCAVVAALTELWVYLLSCIIHIYQRVWRSRVNYGKLLSSARAYISHTMLTNKNTFPSVVKLVPYYWSQNALICQVCVPVVVRQLRPLCSRLFERRGVRVWPQEELNYWLQSFRAMLLRAEFF